MAFYDMPLERLKTYDPDEKEPADFDTFWKNTLEQTRIHSLDARFVRVEVPFRTVEVYDTSFRGGNGNMVKAWLIVPAGAADIVREKGGLPCVVEYIGYGGGRNLPTEWLQPASCGWAHLVMDTRGQGSSWSPGDTPDPDPEGTNPQYPGVMTKGIRSRETYYYKRVFCDAVRAIEAARANPLVDAKRVAVWGGSQGGGISIAAAGLDPSVGWALPDVPFLCHYSRAVEVTDGYPYQELVKYWATHRDKVEESLHTLSYFDGMHFARRARARALFSVALMDDICPPSTVFAAYNRWGGQKDIRVYPYNGHEGGGPFQTAAKLEFLRSAWA